MKTTFSVLLMLLALIGAVITYQAYKYSVAFRSDISQTEKDLKEAQVVISESLIRLSNDNPKFKRMFERFKESSSESYLSPEHIAMLATAIEIFQRFQFNDQSKASHLDIEKLLQAIDHFKNLHEKQETNIKSKGRDNDLADELLSSFSELLQTQ